MSRATNDRGATPDAGDARFTLSVNGVAREVHAAPGTALLVVLREHLRLTGAKRGCDIGVCGSCTVLVDGVARRACRVAIDDVGPGAITTIEGLERADGTLHPIQQAFIEAGAIQCGFCTPGMVLAAKALLDRVARPSRDEIRLALAPNLCRCTGYQQIFEAVELASKRLHEDAPAR
jgi:aerobic carbon-monoxide dehydrogenase small subunit